MRTRLALLVLCLTPGVALAAALTSTYTGFDLKTCRVLEPANTAEEFAGSWLCKGYGEEQVFFSEGDLRQMVAFGRKPQDHCAARQTFSGFNTALSKIEWRLKGVKPFAVIQRWSVSYDPENADKHRTWLVVTKLEPNNSCRVALIEGALPDANTKARQAADEAAPAFNCDKDLPKVISASPVKADELMSGSPCETSK